MDEDRYIPFFLTFTAGLLLVLLVFYAINWTLDNKTRKAQIARSEWVQQRQKKEHPERDKIDYKLAAEEYHKEFESTAILGAIVMMGGLFISCYLFFSLNYKLRKQKLLMYQLTYAAKAKLHNNRNNYTAFIGLIDSNKWGDVREYAEKSAYFYTGMLNNWRESAWTIQRELDLLKKYYDAEKVLNKKVEIIENIVNIDKDMTLFLPEILTTLLHNSMKHAFTNKDGLCKFYIEMKRRKKLLYVVIGDNGNATVDKNYLEKEDSGLNILKDRIEVKLLLKRMKSELKDCFEIETSRYGTTIRFKIPYEPAA